MTDVEVDQEGIAKLIRAKIENLRPKLLDLTKRNPLISTNFSVRSNAIIRVVDELPDVILNTLSSQAAMRFASLPALEEDPKDECTQNFQSSLADARLTDEVYISKLENINLEKESSIEFTAQADRELKDRLRGQLGMSPRQIGTTISLVQHAKNNHISASYDLPLPKDEHEDGRHTDTDIQTLMLPDALERRVNALITKNRTWVQETGIKVMKFAFGFLEWSEPNFEKKSFAPLILFPVEVLKKKTSHGFEFYVNGIDEDAEINAVLAEKLRLEFGIILPELGEQSVEDYLNSIQDLFPSHLNWKIRRFVVIGAFPSARMAMYHDLETTEGHFESHSVISALLGGNGAGLGATPFGEEYETDDPSVEGKVPYLVMDADSSQFSVLVDISDGKNVAVEGPPGTGKSQTIVNAMVGALAENKKVLFVAEKMAALDVVKSRLEALGLGEFMLPLQATRSAKEQVITSIRDRVEMESGISALNLPQKIQQFRYARNSIAEYIEAISDAIEPSGIKVYDILGKCIATNDIWISLPKSIQVSSNINPKKLDAEALMQIEAVSKELSLAWDGISESSEFWREIKIGRIDPFECEEILDLANTLSVDLNEVANQRDTLDSIGLSSGIRPNELDSIINLLLEAYEGKVVSVELVQKLLSSEKLQYVENFYQHCEQYQEKMGYLKRILISPEDSDWLQKLETLQTLMKPLNLNGISDDVLNASLLSLKKVKDGNQSALLNFSPLVKAIPESSDWSIPSLVLASDIINGFNQEVLAYRRSTIANPTSWHLVERAIANADEIKTERKKFEGKVVFDALPSIGVLEKSKDIISSSGIFSFLSSNYRNAKKLYLKIAKGTTFSKESSLVMLQGLITLMNAEKELSENQQLREVLGVLFEGLNTNFEIVESLVNYYKRIDNDLSGLETVELKKFLRDEDLELVASLPQLDVDDPIRCLNEISYAEAFEQADLLDRKFTAAESDVEVIKSLSADFYVQEKITVQVIKSLILKLGMLDKESKEISNDDYAKSIINSNFHGTSSKFEDIQDEVLLARKLKLIPKKFHSLVYSSLANPIEKGSLDVLQHVKKIDDIAKRKMENLMSKTGVMIDCDQTIIGAKSLAQFYADAALDKAGLFANAHFHAASEKFDSLNLGLMVADFQSAEIDFSKIQNVMESILYRCLSKEVYVKHGDCLTRVKGKQLDELRKDLATNDKEVITLTRQELRARLYNLANPPHGSSYGKKSGWTEMALIHNEINKKKRHISVRDLTSRAGKALQELKPCWMMSPLAVAQYIKKDGIKFDLIIIDEASQMTPEDALGALLRANQAMVVGDTNQLPPTSFFRKVFEDEAVDEDEAVLEESVLEMANGAFRPARRLRWHYRSKHESLIAFSNHFVYDDNLIVFPSPAEPDGWMGVSLVKVEGCYSSGTNADESKKVIIEALKFMRTSPDKSLGIVTLNQKQRELLLLEMDYALKGDPRAAKYVDYWDNKSEGLESFFIKNLENVQGDERDVIFISTVYGPERVGGPVMQRFGPINGVAGKRRLNVLFSRAKEKIVTFSSMDSSDITADEFTNQGVFMLKKWLEYSATGVLHSGKITGKEPDSDFEIHVIEVLKSIGCEPVPQVGVAGYFIDIGVRHPSWPHGFILGVECDGASYHSSRSARDRDRLRQEVLEGLGWHFHRIWSTDWFSDPISETRRLREVIQSRLYELNKDDPIDEDIRIESSDKLFSTWNVVEEVTSDERVVKIGDTITIQYLKEPKHTRDVTVDAVINNPEENVISVGSPMGRAVINAEVGEEVEVEIGSETLLVRIDKIV